jgi:hypothetical protein
MDHRFTSLLATFEATVLPAQPPANASEPSSSANSIAATARTSAVHSIRRIGVRSDGS